MTFLTTRRKGDRIGLNPIDAFFNWDLGDQLSSLPEVYRSTRQPALNVDEDENEVVVVTELPGVKRDEIEVDYHDGVLTISGTKQVEKKDSNEARSYREISSGSFSRKVSVGEVEFENATAELKDGLLTITLPRSASKRPQRLRIK